MFASETWKKKSVSEENSTLHLQINSNPTLFLNLHQY